MFKGPKGALIFAGSIMFSVAILVGSEDDEGALVTAADEIGRDRDAFDRMIENGNQPARSARTVRRPQRQPQQTIDDSASFDDELDLIDDTAGFDPTPDIEPPFDTSGNSNEVVIVESYGQIQSN